MYISNSTLNSLNINSFNLSIILGKMPISEIYSEATKTKYLGVRHRQVNSSEVCVLLQNVVEWILKVNNCLFKQSCAY